MEDRPLLSTAPTRQIYLACPETLDPHYHKPQDDRRSSFSSSIHRVVSFEDYDHTLRQRFSKDSITETLNDDEFNQNDDMKRRKQPTHSVAYVQKLEAFFDRFSASLYLENTVAVARDHMANERTYLAWVRTSLSTISFGVAITQLFKLDKSILKDPSMADEMSTIGKPLGMSFVVIGMFYMVFAFIRYFHSQVAMTKGYFPASRGIVILTTCSTLVALIAIFAVIIQKS